MEQLFDVIRRVAAALASARIEYRIVGGVAVFLHVHERDALAARSTRDVDIAVDRRDLARIAEAARPHGFEYRHAAGVDMRVDLKQPNARSAVHLIFVGERVRAEYVEAVPLFSPPVPTKEGVLVAPVADIASQHVVAVDSLADGKFRTQQAEIAAAKIAGRPLFDRVGGVEQHRDEQLEPQTIEGVSASGHRRTTTIAAGAIGNELLITIVSEEWTAPELQVLVMTHRTDPRSGESSYKLLNIVRTEPDAYLFQVPADFTVKDTAIHKMEQ